MKGNLKTIIAILIVISINVHHTRAQSGGTNKTEFSIEVDPGTFFFNGYGVHLRIKPKNSEHMLYGLGTYAMNFPDAFVDMNSENKNKGWEVRLNKGFGLFAEHHFQEVNKKWFLSGQIAIHEYEIKSTEITGSTSYTNLLVMAYGGYTLRPFGNGLHIKPWAGLGYLPKIGGDNELGGQSYDVMPMSMFATLHVGYTF